MTLGCLSYTLSDTAGVVQILIYGQELGMQVNVSQVTKYWLYIAVSALAVSGVAPVLLVSLRTPILYNIIPFKDLFRSALVVHVNLSVLVWMLAMCGMAMSYYCYGQHRHQHHAHHMSVLVFGAGMILISISPFISESYPLINNYIPMLQNLPFCLGLGLITAGIVLNSSITLYNYIYHPTYSNSDIFVFASFTIAIIVLVSILCFAAASYYLKLLVKTTALDVASFYELLFWGGGHTLQFAYVQLMMLSWIIMLNFIDSKQHPNDLHSKFLHSKILRYCFLFNVIIVISNPFIYLMYEVDSAEMLDYFTDQMKYFGGIVSVVMIVYLIKTMVIIYRNNSANKAYLVPVIVSMLLFATGGAIGYMIEGYNAVIPAHYHGSIVGVTISLMGLVFVMLPKVGCKIVTNKWVIIQPLLIGGGQLLHIIGLAWSGGHGAMRKTPGIVPVKAKMGMLMVGAGGFLAIAGGILFIVLCYLSIRNKNLDNVNSLSNSVL